MSDPLPAATALSNSVRLGNLDEKVQVALRKTDDG
jgi:ApbE superfamily uncharacterized protein (UPF0280 family)